MSTPAETIVTEVRRQVDHQLAAASAIDTRAAGLIAGTFALSALVIPRVDPDSAGLIGVATLVVLVLTLVAFVSAIRPRGKAFSYGPDATQLLAFVTDPDDRDDLMGSMASSYVGARNQNESTIHTKGTWLLWGIGGLIATVSLLGFMVGTGGIR